MLRQLQKKTLNFTRNYIADDERTGYPKKLLKKAENFLKTRWHKKIENSKEKVKFKVDSKKFENKFENKSTKNSEKNLSQVEKFHAGKRKGKSHLEAIANKVVPPHVEMV
jgi:hypothetical protein